MPRILLVALLGLAACSPTAPRQLSALGSDSEPNSATVFVAMLGADTVAVERVVRDARGVDMTLVTRVPETQRTAGRMVLDAAGQMTAFTSETSNAGGQVLRTVRMTRDGDSLRVLVVAGTEQHRRALAAGPDALPFVEYAHAPFDVALRRGTRGTLPMATERSVLAFAIEREALSATVRHPSRGLMHVTLGASGELVALDAAETTRKLVVTRAPGVDVEAFMRRAASLDASGRGVGPLSGRAETDVTVAGATIVLDHGQPSLRGRQVWGSVVPYGQVWRLGADRATHLTTDRALVLGSGSNELRIPAGSVTLFAEPEAGGGMLIVNAQTGQNGNSYDAAQDLGRVSFTLERLSSTVERLEIVAEPAGQGGRLVVRWGDRALSVPFRVE